MFKFIRSLGSPTQWEITPYIRWLESRQSPLPDDLADAVARDRYKFELDRTMWYSKMTSHSCGGRSAEIRFRADSERREFEFTYEGLLKFELHVPSRRIVGPRYLIVHELVPIRRRCIRHAMSFFGGDGIVIYAEKVCFREQLLH